MRITFPILLILSSYLRMEIPTLNVPTQRRVNPIKTHVYELFKPAIAMLTIKPNQYQ
jgi:hypothetical protein